MAGRRRVAAPAIEFSRMALDNGLRIVLAPDRGAPVVTVLTSYDVGFRSEPEGRTGFAHLFEHLLYDGSVNLPRLEHVRLIESTGGTFNAFTRPDSTIYANTLPSNGLELALALEADGMRGPRLTEETLQNQISVVKEEIRGNVLNTPYGGFPWIQLPPLLFDTFANAHNGYGGFEHLESATLQDAADFFQRYYAPANAVLAIVGDFQPDAASALVERHFGDIEARPSPARPSWSEPVPVAERRGVHRDRMAPRPALALGYRVPDPIGEVDAYLALVVACALLTDGDGARLHQRLVKADRTCFRVSGRVGMFNTLDGRDPTFLQVLAYFDASSAVDRIVAAIDEEIERLATDVPADELADVCLALVAGYLGQIDSFSARASLLAAFEQQRGDPGFIAGVVDATSRVSAGDVCGAVTKWLQPAHRAVLVVEPGGGRS